MYSKTSISLLVAILTFTKLSNAAQCFSDFTRATFANCSLISEKFAVHWTVEGDSIKLGFQVDQVNATNPNWFAFGISESGGMRGTDIVAIVKADSGNWEASDRFSKEYETPVVDSHQDWTLVQAPQAGKDGKSVTAVVSRKLKTCDADDYDIETGNQPVVWAIGSSATFGYHGQNRGNGYITFIESAQQKADAVALQAIDHSTYRNLTVQMPNIPVSTNATSYQCVNFETPADKKYHIVEFYPKIDTKFIHHIVIYQCLSKPKEALGQVYECMSMSTNCVSISFVWAPGVSKVVYPPQTGFAIGSGAGSMQYGAMQVHYNNPEQVAGNTDSSGLILSYTPTLRQFDIGILTLGTFDIRIPPNQVWNTRPQVCSSSCTKKFNETVTLMSSFMHMHTLGKSIQTKHIRDGTELPVVGLKNYYDFSFQGLQPVRAGTDTLVSGDQLITTCKFDGKGRNSVTTFGESTNEEMCFNFLMYYPKRTHFPDICFSGRSGDVCTSWNNYFVSANGDKDVTKSMIDNGEILPIQNVSYYKPLPAPTCPSANVPFDANFTIPSQNGNGNSKTSGSLGKSSLLSIGITFVTVLEIIYFIV
ncbi:hypothetical protein HK098_000603 [Nowakowskiella sp. JEL0407]|nr:hypothetical protein HK098_000593 [Nowakowskiella sp. JEL0407]KAJ3125111.1 hypothetical protein HK098_000603 [Nowakowskiella sp. JEL0407]